MIFDEDDDWCSSPSSLTPTRERFATPDAFDAIALRARLSLAARTLSANPLLLRKKRKRRDPANGGTGTGTVLNSNSCEDTGKQMFASTASFTGDSVMDMMDVEVAPNSQPVSNDQHQRHHHHHVEAPTYQQAPPAFFPHGPTLRASNIESKDAGYHGQVQGCSAKLCLHCLVRTANG